MLTPENIKTLVRAYIAAEIHREVTDHSGVLATHVLGEVLANRGNNVEQVVRYAMGIARELLQEPKPAKR